MKQFDYQQQISILRILLDIINADGIVDARELFLFNKMKDQFGLKDEDLSAVRTKNSLLALLQIKEFEPIQKKSFAKIMSEMIVIDEDININETAIYDIVCQFCDIDIKFEENLSTEQLDKCSHSEREV